MPINFLHSFINSLYVYTKHPSNHYSENENKIQEHKFSFYSEYDKLLMQ